ncbi:hypothetical protein K3495_g1398 [Podosphaera aphanis]|nr:hypothetical protein K3495_g1398 [Podosphaera aphanis]
MSAQHSTDSESRKETNEKQHSRRAWISKRLANAELKLDFKKCDFAVKEVKYLGFIFTAGRGISVDPKKIEAIKKWELPQTQTGVRSFLGFANFYRDLIDELASLSAPLQRTTRKEFSGRRKLQLDQQARQASEKLKSYFVSAPILALFDPERKIVLETDCSGLAMGVCLSQWNSEAKLRPVGYFSKILSPAECNYDIHDKELLAIMRAVEFWRSELMSLRYQIVILIDHKNLQYFISKRRLSERQVRWKSLFDDLPGIKLSYRPGKDAARLDALSRLEQDTPRDPNDCRLLHRQMKLIEDDWVATDQTAVNNLGVTTAYNNGSQQPSTHKLTVQWKELIKKCKPISVPQPALNNRDSSLGYSPFFLNHGCHIPAFPLVCDRNLAGGSSSKSRKADAFVQKLEEGQALAQVSMTWRQQVMEDIANKSRQQSEVFKVGDCVWLNLKNVATPRPSKKLAWLHNKYKVVKLISPHVIELEVSIGIHPRFQVDMLRRAADDPLPSQKQGDYQPAPVDTTVPREYQEFEIERILRAKNRRRGGGIQRVFFFFLNHSCVCSLKL